MHVNIQHRFNASLGKEDLYYRLKESYRDVRGNVHSLIVLKSELERHLCHRTDTLFNLLNRIILFDLTNFYFEGSKRESRKAKFGRSKEKRNDCKLLLLALSINTEGFIRYSEILEGNTIRHQLKQSGINCYWTEIVRRMSTQKLVTTQRVSTHWATKWN